MNEDNKELLEGIELTDDMLEGISGGLELPENHKIALRNAVARQKLEGWSCSEFIEFLSTATAYAHNPDYLKAAVAYTNEVW